MWEEVVTGEDNNRRTDGKATFNQCKPGETESINYAEHRNTRWHWLEHKKCLQPVLFIYFTKVRSAQQVAV